LKGRQNGKNDTPGTFSEGGANRGATVRASITCTFKKKKKPKKKKKKKKKKEKKKKPKKNS